MLNYGVKHVVRAQFMSFVAKYNTTWKEDDIVFISSFFDGKIITICDDFLTTLRGESEDNMKKMLMNLSKVAAALALVITTCNVNSACLMWLHQPELPEGADSLRKM